MSAVRWFLTFALLIVGASGRAEQDQPSPETEDARPVGFPSGEADSGARGRFFRVETTAKPTTVEAEEPITLTVRITAAERPQRPPRRIDLADMPSITDRFHVLDDMEPIPDAVPVTVLVGLGASPLLIAAALAPETEWIFVYRLKSRSADVVEIPAFTFAYYDPVSTVETPEKRWHVPYADAIPLTVRKRTSGDVPLRAPDWAFRLADGDLLARREPWTPPGPLTLTLLLVVPPVLGLCWYLGWRRLFPDAARRARMNRSWSARRALDFLARARKVPPPHRADVIAAVVAGYLRERLDFPAAEPTPAEVRGHLARLTCSAPLVEQAEAFFRQSDAARFQATTASDDLADAAERLILALEVETSWEVQRSSASAILPLLLAVLATTGAEPLFPPDLSNATIVERAETAFTEGVRQRESRDQAMPHFHDAARCFEELRRRGAGNPTLYRNLGKAHLLADELGQAILAYRRGLRLSPYDAELRAGLAEARNRVNYSGGTFGKLSADRRPSWLPSLRAVWLFAAAAFCYALGWVFLTRWFMLRTRRSLTLGVSALIVAAGLAVAMVFVVRAEREELTHPLVVIVDDGVLLLKGNGKHYPARYDTPINQGVESRLLFERDGWLQIELSGGEVGWVPEAYTVVNR